MEAGKEVGRHHIMTHAYWREGGPEFNNVNIMGVIHGTDKEIVLAHKAAIDEHLAAVGIPVSYTNVFWGGRSEIKPSEISPVVYRDWLNKQGVDPGNDEILGGPAENPMGGRPPHPRRPESQPVPLTSIQSKQPAAAWND